MKNPYLCTSATFQRMKMAMGVLFIVAMLLPAQIACNVETWGCEDTDLTIAATVKQPPRKKLWAVRPTYYHAEPSQTDSRPWETADGSDVRTFHYRDTIYIAVPQDKWKKLRKYANVQIGDMPARIVDKLNDRYNGHDRIDVLMPNGERLSIADSIIVMLW